MRRKKYLLAPEMVSLDAKACMFLSACVLCSSVLYEIFVRLSGKKSIDAFSHHLIQHRAMWSSLDWDASNEITFSPPLDWSGNAFTHVERARQTLVSISLFSRLIHNTFQMFQPGCGRHPTSEKSHSFFSTDNNSQTLPAKNPPGESRSKYCRDGKTL